MSVPRLPRIRMNLDFMPSPLEDRPGLLIRDPFRYSDVTAIIPPALVACLAHFDGVSSPEVLKETLRRLSGSNDVDGLAAHLIDTLSGAAFLEDEAYVGVRELRHREFARAPLRTAIHAGSAYPEDKSEVRAVLDRYLAGPDSPAAAMAVAADPDVTIAIAAPHVSPEGGWRSYAAAYSALRDLRDRELARGRDLLDRTFVILGTSHYGDPERFGLTRKPFVTPLGETGVDREMLDELTAAARDAITTEDYCHSVEHSIEFQVLFLQYVLSPGVTILPILCGAFARSLLSGAWPEDDRPVARFFEALRKAGEARPGRLFWVLGIDMAHVGRRYGDDWDARADRDGMVSVADRDRERLAAVGEGDARSFWKLVLPKRDDLKWCGSAPLYTFLNAVPEGRGQLLRYEQWNIDARSVVSFCGMSFRREPS